MARTIYQLGPAARPMLLVLAGVSCFGAQACSPQDGAAGPGAGGWHRASSFQSEERLMHDEVIAGVSRLPLSAAPWVWLEQQKLLAGEGAASDDFGWSVSLSGNTALVGARGDDDGGSSSGSAYAFVRGATGWSEQGKLVAGDGAAARQFGSNVSLSGDTALVSAHGDGHAGDLSGSAYVFVRSATGWSEQGKLVAGDGAAYDRFGMSVSLSGDTALVGAWGDADAGSVSGSAYVFVRSATGWSEQAKLLAGDGAASDYFGRSVSLSGETALVGAFGDDVGASESGSAYVFVRSATGWGEQAKLVAGDGAASDYFGRSVSLSGDTALVGAHGDADAGSGSGSAYVFVRSATGWGEQGKLLAGDGAADDNFGWSVSVSGDTALVGAHGDADAGFDSGSAYAFVRSATGWIEQGKLVAGDGAAYRFFGYSVSLSGETALVGAFGDEDLGNRAGSAYVFSMRLTDGQACAGDDACGSTFCIDGVCCESACDGPCEACGAVGLKGVCTLSARGSAPASSCDGHLCNGVAGACPVDCAGDAACASTHHCPNAQGCVPKKTDGQPCGGHSGCLSGHCVDGICCVEACDQGCGSCALSGHEGVCRPLDRGHAGTPSCAPYLCGGSDASCPDGCQAHSDCVQGGHCSEGLCQSDLQQGTACGEDDACSTGRCTDGVCCLADSCGAYRCGAAGTCQTACSSSAQCASGHQCGSDRQCEPIPASSGAASEGGACQFGSMPAPGGPLRWLGGLVLLASLGLARGRRCRRLGTFKRSWR